MSSHLARIARIVRHPVKGLPGHDVSRTDLAAGVPRDRMFAFARRPVPEGGAWAATRHFHALVAGPGPADGRVRIDEEAGTATLTHPAYESLTVPLDPPEPGLVARTDWFGGAELHRAEDGYWDDRATVSLLNLASVDALAQAAGQPVDPRRFRANLLLAELPAWAELDLPGARIAVGDARLEVLHPVNRCAATTVDPERACRDLNVPAELATRFGHLYCGLRARVVEPGTVRSGDPVVLLGHGRPTPLHGGPQPAAWPRRARVVERVRHGSGALSLWLADPLAAERPAPRPGQHVVVTAHTDEGPLWRAYTVSAHDAAGRLRITVKHEPDGRMTPHLHRHARPGTLLTLSGPHGGTVLDDDADRPLLLASGGIGITQTVALLHGCVTEQPGRSVEVVHTARRAADLALWPEVLDLAARLPHARTRLHLTRADEREAESLGAHRGRPLLTADPAATAFLCGPEPFLDAARRSLTAAGVPEDRIHQEVFASPGTAGTRGEEPEKGPFTVRFATSGRTAKWRPEDGTLSQLAEDEGLTVPSGCRAGACRSCARPLREGRVVYPTPPALPPDPGTALLCIAMPATDTVIDL